MTTAGQRDAEFSAPYSQAIEIPLTQGYTAIVDVVDADLAQLHWYAYVDPHGLVYARRNVNDGERRITCLLHRAVMEHVLATQLTTEQEVDHKDGNGLNNTRCNLRIATDYQNARNGRRRRNNTSGVPGVGWHKKSGMWVAYICIGGKQRHLGFFENFTDAVSARHEAELKHFGEFSPLLSRSAS